MNKLIALLVMLTLIFTLAACSSGKIASANAVSASQLVNGSGTVEQNTGIKHSTVTYNKEDELDSFSTGRILPVLRVLPFI
jgi:hypothetical protein